NIRRRAGETFRAGQFNCRHSQTLDVARVTNRSHRDPIVNLKKLLARLTKREKQNPVAISKRRDGTTRGELPLDVLAPVGDRFDPTIRLLDHATNSLNTAAILLSGNVVMPSRDTILITGKIFPLRSTPAVAVSDSAAVSSARNASDTASCSLNLCSRFAPQLFS